MKGRITLAAVSLFLAILGGDDLYVGLRNPRPQVLEAPFDGPLREWIEVRGAAYDLEEAISTSGRVELEALLVPLRSGQRPVRIFLETRAPSRLDLFRSLHFGPDTAEEKEAFRRTHASGLKGSLSVRGLRMRGLVAASNARKLRTLVMENGLDLAPDVAILVEDQEPPRWRGYFFLAVALAGLARVGLAFRKPQDRANQGDR